MEEKQRRRLVLGLVCTCWKKCDVFYSVLALLHVSGPCQLPVKVSKDTQLPVHSASIEIYGGIARGFSATARLSCWIIFAHARSTTVFILSWMIRWWCGNRLHLHYTDVRTAFFFWLFSLCVGRATSSFVEVAVNTHRRLTMHVDFTRRFHSVTAAWPLLPINKNTFSIHFLRIYIIFLANLVATNNAGVPTISARLTGAWRYVEFDVQTIVNITEHTIFVFRE